MPNFACDMIAGVGMAVLLCIIANLVFGPENVGFFGGMALGFIGWVIGKVFLSERLERWWYRQNAP